MKEKKSLTRGWKISIIVVSAAAFLLLCVLGAELWLKQTIRKTIEKEAATLTGVGVKTSVGRISVSIPSRSVTVRDITLTSQNKDTDEKDFTLVSLDAGVDKISVRGIGYRKKDGKPALGADRIEIVSPHASMVTDGGKAEKEADGTEKKSLQEMLTEKLHSISVGKLSISGINFDYAAWRDGGESSRIAIVNGGLKIDGFRIDSLPQAADKIFFSDDVRLTADRISYGFDEGDFVLQADTLAMNGAEGVLYLKKAALIPQYPKDEFVRESQKRQDWTEFNLRELNCNGVDYARLLNGKTLAMDSLRFAAGHVASYKNRQVYQEPRVKPMLYQTIQGLPIAVDVKEMSFANLDIAYYELAQEGDTQGVVTFTRGTGTAKNITNIVEGHDRFFTIDMSAYLMGSGQMHALFHFPVSPSDDYWEVSGDLGPMDLTVMNRVIDPLANMKVKTGTVESVHFKITANIEQSHVALTMLYDDLSVALMKKHEDKERKFLSFVADEMVIRNSNPGHNGKTRTGEGEFTRDPQKSMYNYMWKTLFVGIKKTVI